MMPMPKMPRDAGSRLPRYYDARGLGAARRLSRVIARSTALFRRHRFARSRDAYRDTFAAISRAEVSRH